MMIMVIAFVMATRLVTTVKEPKVRPKKVSVEKASIIVLQENLFKFQP